MRLIDADALKKCVKQQEDYDSAYTICAYIDNAPTVELFCSYLSDGEVRQPCVEAPCEYERPQGDLIQSLTELCDRYCKFCPVIGGPNGTDCTDCICTHIRGIIRGKEE